MTTIGQQLVNFYASGDKQVRDIHSELLLRMHRPTSWILVSNGYMNAADCYVRRGEETSRHQEQ